MVLTHPIYTQGGAYKQEANASGDVAVSGRHGTAVYIKNQDRWIRLTDGPVDRMEKRSDGSFTVYLDATNVIDVCTARSLLTRHRCIPVR